MKKIFFITALICSLLSYAQCGSYGSFNFLITGDLGIDLSGAEIVDADGDGVLDIFVMSYNNPSFSNYFSISEITGINSFAYTSYIPVNWPASFSDFSISDVDNDGDIDVFILFDVYQGTDYIELYLNDGSNQFSTSGQVFSNVSSNENIALDDLDGDGYVDAVFSNSVYLNDGTGQFNNSTNYIGNNVSLADFDGDGDLDAINNDSIYFNNGSGFFVANPLGFSGISFPIIWANAMSYPKIIDFDVDGDIDVFRKDSIFINDGSGNFTTSISFPFSFSASMHDVEFADIDGDGDVDVVSSVGSFYDYLKIFINDGLGNFTPSTQTNNFNLYTEQYDIELADLNNDGYPEILGFQGYVETNIFENTYSSYPYDLNLTLSSNQLNVCCSCEDSINITSSLTSSGGLNNYIWNTGETSSNITVNSSGTYVLEVSNSTGCYDIDSVTITDNVINPLENAAEICMVTVESTSTQNKIIWSKVNDDVVESYNIYRDIVGTYTLVGNVLQSDSSYFIDATQGINPNTTSYRYKISLIDTCGVESNISDYHKTIHLQFSSGVQPAINIDWDDYYGFAYPYYRILRDDNGTGLFEVLDSVSSGITSYTDALPPSNNSRYIVEVIHPTGCDISKSSNYITCRSNVVSTGITGLTTINSTLNVFPNPTQDQITIDIKDYNGPVNVELYDLQGRLLETTKNTTISMGEYAKGIYVFKISYGEKTEEVRVVRD